MMAGRRALHRPLVFEIRICEAESPFVGVGEKGQEIRRSGGWGSGLASAWVRLSWRQLPEETFSRF